MKIEILPGYRISSDENQFILEKKADRKQGSKSKPWRAFGYYTSLEKAVEGLYERRLRDSNATTAEELHLDALRAVGQLKLGLAPLYKVQLIKTEGEE